MLNDNCVNGGRMTIDETSKYPGSVQPTLDTLNQENSARIERAMISR